MFFSCAVGHHVGIIKPNVLDKLLLFKDVFEGQMSAVGKIQFLVISKGLKNHQQRTAALNNMFVKLKEQDAFPCLRGWRNEMSSGTVYILSFTQYSVNNFCFA